MKKVTTLLSMLLLSMVFYCGNAIAGENKDKIDWEEGHGTARSIFPISGYVEDGMVSIYLYESPSKATVHITDESGAIIYESDYADPSNIVIDLTECDNGAYQVTVEYGEKMFVGAFEM